MLGCVLNGCLIFKEIAKLCFDVLIFVADFFYKLSFFCLVVLSFVKRRALTSSTLSIYLSISPFFPLQSFCRSDVWYIYIWDCYDFFVDSSFYYYVMSLSPVIFFTLKSILSYIYIGTLAFLSLMFIWYIFLILLFSVFL